MPERSEKVNFMKSSVKTTGLRSLHVPSVYDPCELWIPSLLVEIAKELWCHDSSRSQKTKHEPSDDPVSSMSSVDLRFSGMRSDMTAMPIKELKLIVWEHPHPPQTRHTPPPPRSSQHASSVAWSVIFIPPPMHM
ncbi:hypothetical protein Tco_1378800 [Tanacetum coccineum]